ncbi:MAG: T9SS type A sorting domain-containing protein [candidate division Zixibacteria bacterium]
MKRINFLIIVVAILAVPCMVFSAGHRVAVGDAITQADNVITVPVVVENQAGLMAADIPLEFSEGVTLMRVDFEGTRVEHFDLKVANIDNEKNRVVIGLLTQMSATPVADLDAGSGPVAILVFKVDDPTVTSVELNSFEMEKPKHQLTFIYHQNGEDGPVGQTRVDLEMSGVAASLGTVPHTFSVDQNYPNPFNPSTTFSFTMPEAGDYSIDIYNVLGQRVESMSGTVGAGPQTQLWDASGNASGVYFYKLTTGKHSETKKMVLLK